MRRSMWMTLLVAASLTGIARADDGVRLFILSGQSNMAGLNPDVSFTPTVTEAFGAEKVLVVKDAQGGRPIVQWYTGDPKKPGPLYVRLMQKVRAAMKGKKIDSVVFVWMQGESDTRRQATANKYAANLTGLIEQVRNDLKRPDTRVVIGRICNWRDTPTVKTVRAAQVAVAEADPLAECVDTDPLDRPKGNVHYSKKGYEQMGRLFAETAIKLLKQPQAAAGETRPATPPKPPKPRTANQEAVAMLKMARAYITSNRPDKARAVLKKIVADFPDTPTAKVAAAELKKLP